MTGASLAGRRVLVLRPADRAEGLVAALERRGATAVAVPTIAIEPLSDPAPLRRAVRALAGGNYAWVVFTSVPAVRAVLAASADPAPPVGLPAGAPPAGWPGTRCAAAGPATRAALTAAGIAVELVPAPGGTTGAAQALVEIWPPPEPGAAVLFPRSSIAAPTLADGLRGKGYRVDEVEAYRTVAAPPEPAVAAELAAGTFDAVLFTSPSTVDALAAVAFPASTACGAIGPTTAAALHRAGRRIDFVAVTPGADALVAALVEWARPTDQENP